MTDFEQKLIVALVQPFMALLLAALVGQRISSWWNEKQKRRELELALANTFYTAYGDFCAIWKQWNYVLSTTRDDTEDTEDFFLRIHERACLVEGGLEAVLLKIAAERRISKHQGEELGNLRQAFQVLRERIENHQSVSYGWDEHPDYLEFKRLATLVGHLLISKTNSPPSAMEAYETFKEITDNRHEGRWKKAGL